MLPTITGEFGVFRDPELRFTPSGIAVCKLSLIAKDRKQENGQWVDGDPLFLTGTVWRKVAENVAESIQKGSTVNIVGRLEMRSYETKEGEKRTSYEVNIQEIGLSLRWNPAKQTDQDRPQGAPQPVDDPWAPKDPTTDEPPF